MSLINCVKLEQSEVNEVLLLFLCDRLLIVRSIWVLVEVLNVFVARQIRDPRRLDALLLYNGPIDSLEPSVGFHVLSSATQAAESLGYVLLKQTCYKGTSSHRNGFRELVVTYCDSLVDLVRIGVVERRIPESVLEEFDDLP